MSADNWADCPRCASRKDEALIEAGKLYGKVPQKEYLAAVKAAQETATAGESMFREDYEIYLKDGVVHVSYSGWCQVCGYGTDLQCEHPIPDGES